MKNMKNKVLGIFLAAVMVISGVTFASDYIYAVGSEEAGVLSTEEYPELGEDYKAKECTLNPSTGEIVKKDCLYNNIYYDDKGKEYPALMTGSILGPGYRTAHNTMDGRPIESAISDIKYDHEQSWFPTNDACKSKYTHYISIKFGGDKEITYVRCDFFMNGMVDPSEDNYKVTYWVKDINNEFPDDYIDEEAVKKFSSPSRVPQQLPDRPYFVGKEINYWEDETGKRVENFNLISIESERNFYAVLKDIEKKKYSVNYDSNQTLTDNNNKIENDLQTPAESGTEITLDNGKEIFSNIKEINGTNVIFIGWTPDRTSKIISKNDSAPETMLTANSKYIIGNTDKTFYAVWAADENGNGTPDYKEGTITITKKIDKLTNIDGQGKPTFIFKLESSDKSYVDYKVVRFDGSEQNLDSYYSKTVSFTGLPAGKYKISELDGIRYDLMNINGNDVNGVDSVEIVLSEKVNKTVDFENKLNYENNISDTGALTNTFKLENGNVIYTTKEVD